MTSPSHPRSPSRLRVNLALSLLLFATSIFAMGAQAANTFKNKDGVAIGGYDVVAYFMDHKAKRGSKKFSSSRNGAKWYFASAAHKKAFDKAPKKYLPSYGGYCAFAMAAKNATVPSDPRTFKIYNGKLLLFFNDYYEGTPFNTIVPWNGDEKTMKSKADRNWKGHKK